VSSVLVSSDYASVAVFSFYVAAVILPSTGASSVAAFLSSAGASVVSF